MCDTWYLKNSRHYFKILKSLLYFEKDEAIHEWSKLFLIITLHERDYTLCKIVFAEANN